MYPFVKQVNSGDQQQTFLTKNFFDPELASDGGPYGPWKFKEIVRECYLISKNTNTSYTDVLNMTPLERKFVIDLLIEETNKTREALEKARAEREANRNRR